MKACPNCKHGVVQLEKVLASKPLGSYSISGAMTKIVAQELWVATCTVCSLHVVGKLVDPVIGEDGLFRGGHFEELRG